MKKLARNISILLIALLLACCLIVGFTACGDDDSSSSGSGSGTEQGDGNEGSGNEGSGNEGGGNEGGGNEGGGTSGDTSGLTVVSDGKFEAEYTDLMSNHFGTRSYAGYSQNGFAPAVRCSDASNSYAVGNLYTPGAYVFFEITSSANATVDLYLAMSMESQCMQSNSLTSITLSSSDFRVYVNPTSIEITRGSSGEQLTTGGFEFDVAGMTDTGFHKAFKEYKVENISLVEGVNYIVLQTGNTSYGGQGGSMKAIAPLIDYIRIDSGNTGITLSWSPVSGNTSSETSALYSG